MPRKKWIDKSKATTFQLVHRPQDDPRIHDESSNPLVFREVAPAQSHKKSKNLERLEAELFGDDDGVSISSFGVRDNEGEAAEFGVYFDDTKYDYMQHMRDINEGSGLDGESVFVEAYSGNKQKQKGKGKNKISLEDALRDASLRDREQDQHLRSGSIASSDYTASSNGNTTGSLIEDELSRAPGTIQRNVLETQQDVPDEISGFQPDMDPRLREVLEALEDEAYVEDNEEDFFNAITEDGEEMTLDEFEARADIELDEDEDGWESDATEKPYYEEAPKASKSSNRPFSRISSKSPVTSATAAKSYIPSSDQQHSTVPILHQTAVESDPKSTPAPEITSSDPNWLDAFHSYKRSRSHNPRTTSRPPSTIHTNTDSLGPIRRKRRKGALTDRSSSYSMSSSSLSRTEGQTLLDARFERIERLYAVDEYENEDESVNDGISETYGDSDEEEGDADTDIPSRSEDAGNAGVALPQTPSVGAGSNNAHQKANETETSRVHTSESSNIPPYVPPPSANTPPRRPPSSASIASSSRAPSIISSSASSAAPPLVMTGAFESLMDDFLSSTNSPSTSRKGRSGTTGFSGLIETRDEARERGKVEAMRDLDEFRKALGPARMMMAGERKRAAGSTDGGGRGRKGGVKV